MNKLSIVIFVSLLLFSCSDESSSNSSASKNFDDIEQTTEDVRADKENMEESTEDISIGTDEVNDSTEEGVINKNINVERGEVIERRGGEVIGEPGTNNTGSDGNSDEE